MNAPVLESSLTPHIETVPSPLSLYTLLTFPDLTLSKQRAYSEEASDEDDEGEEEQPSNPFPNPSPELLLGGWPWGVTFGH